MGNPVKITDSFGDVKKEYTNIKEMLKIKFDNFINEEVNERGNTNISYDDTKFKRIKYIFNKFAAEVMEEKIIKQTKEIATKMETFIEDAIKTHVEESVFKHAGLGKIINSYKKAIDHK